MKQAIQSTFIIIGLFVLLFCWLGAGAIGQVTAPAPTPTPEPTPGSDGAAIVRETFDGLEAVGVGESIRSGARANDANTAAVHTSDLGQFVRDIQPLLPLCIVGVLGASVALLGLAGAWVLVRLRGDKDTERLAQAIERFEQLTAWPGATNE